MPVASFEALSAGLCELAGLGVPDLEPDDQGTQAFSMRLQDAVIDGMQLRSDGGRRAIFMAAAGRPAEAPSPRNWSLLMRANACWLGEGSPHFSRHPRTGNVVMQWSCHLDRTTITDAYQDVLRVAQVVRHWRGDPEGAYLPAFSASRGNCQAPAVECGTPVSPSPLFTGLYRQVCVQLQSQPGELATRNGVCAFSLRHGGTRVRVAHAPLLAHDLALVTMRLGPAWDARDPAIVTSLMEANFALLMQPHEARFCMDPAGSGLLLQFVFPLPGGSAAHLLARTGQTAEIIHEWERVAFKPAPMPFSRSEP